MTKPKKTRRRFTTEQKTAILRRHLVDKVAVSALCDEYGLQPSVFYGWQKALFENMDAALDRQDPAPTQRRERELARKVERLEAQVAKKDAVIADIASIGA